MRKNKQEEGSITTCFFEIGLGTNVVRKRNAWQVLDIFMFFVDDLGQLAKFTLVHDFFFKDPHVDLTLTELETIGVVANEDADGRSPVS